MGLPPYITSTALQAMQHMWQEDVSDDLQRMWDTSVVVYPR
jgi:hypothetical protein